MPASWIGSQSKVIHEYDAKDIAPASQIVSQSAGLVWSLYGKESSRDIKFQYTPLEYKTG
jgi:uncharacterized protein with PQ loop repeat